jgi:hypothetical protein
MELKENPNLEKLSKLSEEFVIKEMFMFIIYLIVCFLW